MALQTKFGNATIASNGYYCISSSREGNHKKLLHRLIYEDFWGVKLPEEIVVHHKDENKLNNCILNLEAMEDKEHRSLHSAGENNSKPWLGKTFSEDHCTKISKATNTTGYFRVSKCKSKDRKQGFAWVYWYYENGKHRAISSVNIDKLEEKVVAKGLPWFKLSDVEVEA